MVQHSIGPHDTIFTWERADKSNTLSPNGRDEGVRKWKKTEMRRKKDLITPSTPLVAMRGESGKGAMETTDRSCWNEWTDVSASWRRKKAENNIVFTSNSFNTSNNNQTAGKALFVFACSLFNYRRQKEKEVTQSRDGKNSKWATDRTWNSQTLHWSSKPPLRICWFVQATAQMLFSCAFSNFFSRRYIHEEKKTKLTEEEDGEKEKE